MSQPTKSDSAVLMANQLIAICIATKNLNDQIVAFNTKNTDLSPDTIWRQMATATPNADGSQGTADGTPNLAHPITVGGINRAEADLLTGLTFAVEIIQFLNGTLATNRAAINRLTVLDTLAG